MAELAIEEIVAQRARNGAEGQLIPRDFFLAKQRDFEAFGSRAEIEVAERRTEHHVDLTDVRQADYGVQTFDRDARVGFLQRFTQCACGERLAVFEKARGQRPESLARLDRALAQQHVALPLGQAADDDLWILVVDRAALLSDVS